MILDGAMGTMIQSYKLSDKDFRGNRFKNNGEDLKGNNDILCPTQPKIIQDIHENIDILERFKGKGYPPNKAGESPTHRLEQPE